MPLIQVKHSSPLSEEQLASLIADLTDAYVRNSTASPASVQVLVENVPGARWGIGGQSLQVRNSFSDVREGRNL